MLCNKQGKVCVFSLLCGVLIAVTVNRYNTVGVFIYNCALGIHTEGAHLIAVFFGSVNDLAFVEFIGQMGENFSRQLHTHADVHSVGFGIDESGVGYNYVDCSYLQYMLEYGVVFIAFVLAVYTIIIYRAVKKEDYYLVWICMITLVFSITEPWLFNFTFNPIPILVFSKMKDRKKDGVLTHEQKCENCYSNT